MHAPYGGAPQHAGRPGPDPDADAHGEPDGSHARAPSQSPLHAAAHALHANDQNGSRGGALQQPSPPPYRRVPQPSERQTLRKIQQNRQKTSEQNSSAQPSDRLLPFLRSSPTARMQAEQRHPWRMKSSTKNPQTPQHQTAQARAQPQTQYDRSSAQNAPNPSKTVPKNEPPQRSWTPKNQHRSGCAAYAPPAYAACVERSSEAE